ncbi:MAG TPA: RNA 2',3'-cyclic phosphodiesterase [Tepidisphaeraceae bacterium]|jgi:2'-5' RNA ligase
MRMFLAIELPEDVREHLVRVQEAVAPALDGIAMTRPENLHVTVKFLGEVDEAKSGELCDSIAKVTSAAIDLEAVGVECFPPRGTIRIVAAQMAGDVQALAGVHAAIEQRCKFLGFEKENRKYRPHVTLGRARKPLAPNTRKTVEEASAKLWPGPRFHLKDVVLMQSKLKPAGAEYLVVARFPLGGA